jgi:hypothetical protein
MGQPQPYGMGQPQPGPIIIASWINKRGKRE